MEIRLATRQDVQAMMALEERYFIGNLDASELSHGFISVLHPQEWFEQAADSGALHVAVSEDAEIMGFIAVTDPPAVTQADVPPIVQAIVELAGTAEFDGQPIAAWRYAIRGPVLIDRSARGQGLYSRFNEVTRRAYAQRYDVAVLFVAADNPLSLHTTTTKLGAQPVAEFEVDSRRYHLLAFRY